MRNQLVKSYWRFGGVYCLHLQGLNVLSLERSVLNAKTVMCSKIPVTIYQSTRRHIIEYLELPNTAVITSNLAKGRRKFVRLDGWIEQS